VDTSFQPSRGKRRYLNYKIYKYEEIEDKFLSSPKILSSTCSESRISARGTDCLPPDTLCWVMISKGKGKSKKLMNRARVVDAAIENSSNDNPNNKSPQHKKHKSGGDQVQRILVRYPKGSTYRVRRENILPVLTIPTLVMVLPETRIYHRYAHVHTRANDAFCEIGCDVGILVHRVWTNADESVRQWIWGLDKCPLGIASAQKRYPVLASQFRVWDVPLAAFASDKESAEKDNVVTNTDEDTTNAKYKTTEQQTTAATSPLPMDLFPRKKTTAPNTSGDDRFHPNLVVAIDINGNRELPAVRECMQMVIHEWKPRLIIVKSRALYADLNNN